jgi:hypothetical protein
MRKLVILFISLLAILAFASPAMALTNANLPDPWGAFSGTDTNDIPVDAYGLKATVSYDLLTGAPECNNTTCSGSNHYSCWQTTSDACYIWTGLFMEPHGCNGSCAHEIEVGILTNGCGVYNTCDGQENACGGTKQQFFFYAYYDSVKPYYHSTVDCNTGDTPTASTNYTMQVSWDATNQDWNITDGPLTGTIPGPSNGSGSFVPQKLVLGGILGMASHNNFTSGIDCTQTTFSYCVRGCAKQSGLQYQLANGTWTDITVPETVSPDPPHQTWVTNYTYGREYIDNPTCSA